MQGEGTLVSNSRLGRRPAAGPASGAAQALLGLRSRSSLAASRRCVGRPTKSPRKDGPAGSRLQGWRRATIIGAAGGGRVAAGGGRCKLCMPCGGRGDGSPSSGCGAAWSSWPSSLPTFVNHALGLVGLEALGNRDARRFSGCGGACRARSSSMAPSSSTWSWRFGASISAGGFRCRRGRRCSFWSVWRFRPSWCCTSWATASPPNCSPRTTAIFSYC